MRDGGMGAQFFGLVSLPVSKRMKGMARVIDEQIDALEETIARAPGQPAPGAHGGRGRGVPRATARSGRCSASRARTRSRATSSKLDGFARRGVRYLGLLHFTSNEAGFPAYGRGRRDDEGLTPWGHDLVERCEQRASSWTWRTSTGGASSTCARARRGRPS